MIIAKKFEFNWREAIENAKNKDMWVDESQILIILEQFDIERLNQVKWIVPINTIELDGHKNILINDLLLGKFNSLYKFKA